MYRTIFLDSARTALDLAARPEVAAAWRTESSCPGMTVGGLTHHLLAQADRVATVLAAESTDRELVTAKGHYERSTWVGAPRDEEVNTHVRDSSDAEAAVGPEQVLAWGEERLARAADLLRQPRVPDTVAPGWLTWGLLTDEFLLTRLVELTVHSDDLAASVDLETPEFRPEAVAAVVHLLSDVSVRRHGQTAVLRALSRPQRAPGHVSAL